MSFLIRREPSPTDHYLRAQAHFWANFADKKLEYGAKRRGKRRGDKEFIQHLKVLEQQLGDKPYLRGDTFGYVDVAIIPFYTWFYVFETTGDFKVKETSPKIIEWAKRRLERETVKALPDQDKGYGFFLESKKLLGIE